MKLLSDSRRRRKFIIWLEGLRAPGAAEPGGAEGETEAAAGAEVAEAAEAVEARSEARKPSRQPRPTGPGGRGGARLSARERAEPGAGAHVAPPRAAEPAPPQSRRRPRLAACAAGCEQRAFGGWGHAVWGGPGLLRPERGSLGRAWKLVLLPKNRDKRAQSPYHLFDWERKEPCPGNCPHSL